MFAIGGFNGLTTISGVECYDDTTDEWYAFSLVIHFVYYFT